MTDSLAILQEDIVACSRCPRLVDHRRLVALTPPRAFRGCEYWARPVPSFGDPQARILVLGLAPGAHGANRTGRVFTGDRSGDFLFGALHRAGLASRPSSRERGDGLQLEGCYISNSVRCVPPGNRPSRTETGNCRLFLERELALLPRVTLVLALGYVAFDAYLQLQRSLGASLPRKDFRFGHGQLHWLPHGPALMGCYHPSPLNTRTGRLTMEMMDRILAHARAVAGA